jgi:hypothetical protein
MVYLDNWSIFIIIIIQRIISLWEGYGGAGGEQQKTLKINKLYPVSKMLNDCL